MWRISKWLSGYQCVCACCCLLSWAACGGGDDPTPTPVPSPTPEPVCTLAWEPSALDFGTVLTHESASAEATLVSVGDLPCTVRELSITGPASSQFSLSDGPDLPRTMSPGSDGLTFTFKFAPSFAGEFDAYVTLDAQDEDPELTLQAVAVMPDDDGDLVDDRDDNCLGVANPDQWDWDEDGLGDACDDCPRDADNDVDGDGVCGNTDNCPETYNPDQGDADMDFLGDACDTEVCDGRDNDGDGLVDEDFDDLDGIGGADCHDDDGDGLSEDEGDCNDAVDTAYPGGVEQWYDGIDSDCDGDENPDPCAVLPSATTVSTVAGCALDLEPILFSLCLDSCEGAIRAVGTVANHGTQPSPDGLSVDLVGVTSDGISAILDSQPLDPLDSGAATVAMVFEPGTFNDLEVYDHVELRVSAATEDLETVDCDDSNDVSTYPVSDIACSAPDYCATPRAAYPVASDPTCSIELPTHRISAVVAWRKGTFEAFPDSDQSAVTPMVGNLTDDNGDGIIDDRDTTDIVFVTYVGDQYDGDGVLRVVSGDGGHEWWSAEGVYALSGVALADADSDGSPEIYAMNPDGDLVAFSADGSLLWTCSTGASPATYPAVADLEGDGVAEILAGNTVCDHNGNVVVVTELDHTSETTYFEDLDQDGSMEIVSGAGISSADGSTVWEGPGGHAASADFDDDGDPELAIVFEGRISLYDDLFDGGTALWSSILFEGGDGSPTIADFDNDGAPEIGVAGAHFYMMFDADGTMVWNSATLDAISMQTAGTVYDLDGNGTAEVIYADQENFWIMDGVTGNKLFQDSDHSSSTMQENPVVADLDGDSRAEIVLTSGDYGYAGWTGITVLQAPDNNWVTARSVWNQHTYRRSHVNDDLSIPPDPEAPWTGDNSFRQAGSGQLVPFDVPDLVPVLVTRCEDACPGSSSVVFQVENHGLAEAPADTPYSIYGLTEGGEWLPMISGTIPDAISAGWTSPSIEVTLTYDLLLGYTALRLVVDDDGNGPGDPNECDETNNSLDLAWPCS